VSFPVKSFKSPKRSLGNLDADATATLITSACDLALVVDRAGIIRDVSYGTEELAHEGCENWVDRPWAETVTADSRAKVEALLREATTGVATRRRHINHASPHGDDLPILYSTLKVGKEGRVVALGRDLRALSVLQKRLLDAQQSMQRDYARLRHVESRYRLLFQTAAEAVLILDGTTEKVLEANPAAAEALGETPKRLIGRGFLENFEAKSSQAVSTLLAAVRAAGRADDVVAQSVHDGRQFIVTASLLRQDDSSLFLVRLKVVHAETGATEDRAALGALAKLIDHAPDAFVTTSVDGRIVTANRAFLELAQLASEEQARGESLERWLGRPGVDLNVLIANLRQHGAVRLFATTLRGEYGSTADVEISAVSVVGDGEHPNFGFTIRNIGHRPGGEYRPGREVPRSVEQLTELVGRVSLKDLVREATDVIERLCIEAALELTKDNRASAAEMLGLSRQSLYVKLRRYGLGDLASENEE
jgi:transcriptional regulator PpsR